MRIGKKLNYEEGLRELAVIEASGKHVIYYGNDWHWIIDGISVWPTTKRFHRPDGRGGHYQHLKEIFE